MIKIQGKLPRTVFVAVSGGVDSMAALDFLGRKHQVHALYFNHGTEHGQKAQEFLKDYCAVKNIPLSYIGLDEDKPTRYSTEEWWREKRYAFFNKFIGCTVVTCHHLDDCVETWVMSSMHGTGKWIPYRRNHVVRPFRLTRKREMELWCRLNNVPWIEDDSNNDVRYTRNYVRHKLMPHVLEINPGIYKTIKKKVLNDVT